MCIYIYIARARLVGYGDPDDDIGEMGEVRIWIHLYIWIYQYKYVCVCIWRERARDIGMSVYTARGWRDTETQTMRLAKWER